MIEYGLQGENAIQFTQIDGRWYSKVCITVQGMRVGYYYFEVLDNEDTNMLNTVLSQSRAAWQRGAQEQLQAVSQQIGNLDSDQ
jgi:hypothetical protein